VDERAIERCDMTRIVVGVDGSRNSRRALRRAIDEARLRDGTVDAVYVYEPPHRSVSDDLIGLPLGAAAAVGAMSTDRPRNDPPSREREAHLAAERRLAQFVEEAMDGAVGRTPRPVVIPDDNAAEALIGHAKGADLLVIGTRGLGGFAGMLLGSVAHQCIQRSACPMLILPPDDD
jgi:nucleotide-binding universal stress UspA family protein